MAKRSAQYEREEYDEGPYEPPRGGSGGTFVPNEDRREFPGRRPSSQGQGSQGGVFIPDDNYDDYDQDYDPRVPFVVSL